jgi:hypothetical protein
MRARAAGASNNEGIELLSTYPLEEELLLKRWQIKNYEHAQ